MAYLYLPVGTPASTEIKLEAHITDFAEKEGYSFVLLFVGLEATTDVLSLFSLTDHIELFGSPDILVVGPSSAAFEVLRVYEKTDGVRIRTLSEREVASVPHPRSSSRPRVMTARPLWTGRVEFELVHRGEGVVVVQVVITDDEVIVTCDERRRAVITRRRFGEWLRDPHDKLVAGDVAWVAGEVSTMITIDGSAWNAVPAQVIARLRQVV